MDELLQRDRLEDLKNGRQVALKRDSRAEGIGCEWLGTGFYSINLS